MDRIRTAAFAGSFYPADANQLRSDLEKMLSQSKYPLITSIKALIVPHAGYVYSGQVAAEAYHQLIARKQDIKQIILIGPSHRVWFKGLAVPSSERFATPLGSIDLDCERLTELTQIPQVHFRDDAHQLEHSLEVQLPFIKHLFNQAKIIPIVVGESSTEEIVEVLKFVWGDDSTLVLISSDLSHFENYQTAQKIDRQTTQLIESLNYQSIKNEMACGNAAIKAILKLAKEKSMQITTLAQCNSGDTAGDKDRVVGYAAYAIH